MKALLFLLAVTTLTMVGCVAGPYDASYSYQSYQPATQAYYQSHQSYQPAQQSYYHGNRSHCNQNQSYVVAPQYYRVQDYSCQPTRYKNYSNAPIIVERPQGNIIIPKSWD